MATEQGIATGLGSQSWNDGDWTELVGRLIEQKMVSWKDIAALLLGHLNPLQVGTSLASNKAMQAAYGKGTTMRHVIEWLYEQPGRCRVCGTRLELQVDHNVAKTTDLNLMTLLCRRHNVIRRFDRGGITDLTAESALMWILLTIRPLTRRDFVRLCRLEGMTMADVRFQEAWAMAEWLSREKPSLYEIDDESGEYDVVLWPDRAVTRRRATAAAPPGGATVVATSRRSHDVVAFVVRAEAEGKFVFEQYTVDTLPFVYDLGPRPPQEIALHYQTTRKFVVPRSPRHRDLVALVVRRPDETLRLRRRSARKRYDDDVTDKSRWTFDSIDEASIELET